MVDLFFDWYNANISNLYKYTWFKYGFTKNLTQEEAKEISDKAFQELENVFLSQRKFISSHDKITIADLAVAFHLAGTKDLGYEFSPRLEEYMKSVYEQASDLQKDVESYVALKPDWSKDNKTK